MADAFSRRLASHRFVSRQAPVAGAAARSGQPAHVLTPLPDIPPLPPPQVMYLKGIAIIYNFNVFLYIFLILSVLSIIFMSIRGPKQWKRKKVEDSYQY